MKKVRKNTFETNSSSTHSLVIPKEITEDFYDLIESLDHNYVFSREESRLVDCWDEKLAYTYMILISSKIKCEEMESFKERIGEMFEELNPECEAHRTVHDHTPEQIFAFVDGKYDSGEVCVDHSGDMDKNFVPRVLEDDEFLKRFIFSKQSYITIGGDEYRGYNIKTIGFEYDYEANDAGENEEFWNKLEEYKERNDVYLKGN